MNRKLVLAISAALMTFTAIPLHAGDDGERTAGQVIDDISVAGKTKAQLAADPITDAINIDVEVDKDMVQLNGFVDSAEERNRAGEIARSVKGVASVKNNLQIQPRDRTAGEYVDDKVLVADVKAALANDPVAHALKIDIEADRGVISLGGHVDSQAEREAAFDAARKVAGVTQVINNLDVRS